MKTVIRTMFLIILCTSASYGQPDTIYRGRRADTVKHFFISSFGPFDQWPNTTAKRTNHYFAPLGTDSFRYINLYPQDTGLHYNAETRGFWDGKVVPTDPPAPPDTVTGGQAVPLLNVIMLSPYELLTGFDNAKSLRFESECHTKGVDSSEYYGFLKRPSLPSHNAYDRDGTFPKFLIGSSRNADTASNVIKVRAVTDTACIIGDSVWNEQVFLSGASSRSWANAGYSHRMLLRFRVRVDSAGIDTSALHAPDLFSIQVVQKNGTTSNTVLNSTIKVDTRFIHLPGGFDTIDVPFLGTILADTADGHTFFSVRWLGKVSMTMDYMELMTAHLHTDDNVGYGDKGYYSYEDLTANHDLKLRQLLDTLRKNYTNKAQYIMTAEEWHLANAKIIKRAEKLLRDSGGALSIMSFFHDSSDQGLQHDGSWGFYGFGNPIQFRYDVEGVRLGWLDSNYYADPKFFWTALYPWGYKIPCPKRAPLATGAYSAWELQHMPTSVNPDTLFCLPYSRISYLDSAQGIINEFIKYMRHAKRACIRNQNIGQRFGVSVQVGAGLAFGKTSRHPFVYAAGQRAVTAPEIKIQMHLATSVGATGLIHYILANTKKIDPNHGDNGGLMNWDGSHTDMVHTFLDTLHGAHDSIIAIVSGDRYMGWKETYDSVRILNPLIRKYGDALLNAKYIGDWTASELPYASLRDSLPFKDSSIASLDDSLRKDAFKINKTDGSTDTANRTFVHISMWLDTTSSARSNHSDTLLYITNMRTDDSYDTTEVPTTIDRRLITLRLKRPHIILDVLDTNGGQLDNAKIWTPYVGASDPEDSLKVRLLAGDGILVRLMDTIQGSMHQMQYSVNFPKNTSNYVDHGRLQFDRPVPGVKNIHNDFSVPSSSKPYSVGIPDTSHAVIWQDSLLFQKFDTTRKEKWRQHHWFVANPTGTQQVFFGNKLQLLPSTLPRPPITSTDSIAHQIVIKTDLEGISSIGKIRFKDPFLVDSATRNNVYDTLPKSSPFLPHVLSANRMPGADSEHYGGIFLLQNAFRLPFIPIYSANAYSTILSVSGISKDTVPFYTDWSFIEWATNDTAVFGDIVVWQSDPDSMKFNPKKNPALVFGKDSAIYTARYKAHMAAYTESGNTADSGACCNNQRKLYFRGDDSLGRHTYMYVYSSLGRIYCSVGTKTGTNDNAIIWSPERLLSSWKDNHSHFPAVGYHPGLPEKYHYVFEDDNSGNIKLALIDTSGWLDIRILDMGVGIASVATPAIASTDFPWAPIDLAAWRGTDGIHLRAMAYFGWSGAPVTTSELVFGNASSAFPTLWMDSCYDCSVGNSKAKFWLSWQQDTIIKFPQGTQHDSLVTDIMGVRFEVQCGSQHQTPSINALAGGASNVTDISRLLTPFSVANLRPCLAGMRLDTTPSVQVKIAYEAVHGPPGIGFQGINIGNNRNGAGWTNTLYLTSLDLNNLYRKPSIEVSRFQKAGAGLVEHLNWYSLDHEYGAGGMNVLHWAFDSATQRVTANAYTNLHDPQIAVTPQKIDIDLYRMAQTPSPNEPRWMISGYTGLYKLGTNDSLWGYHSVTETDSASGLLIEHGVGEFAVDDGKSLKALDLKERDDTLRIDSGHPKEYFMQSVPFTLPSGGTIQYCPWVRVSDDSTYSANFDSIIYALDFFDTSGKFQTRIDSMIISDSVSKVNAILRSISVNTKKNLYGYLVLRRVTGKLTGNASLWLNFISRKRLSIIEALKRSAGNTIQNLAARTITLSASPNPFRNEVNVFLGIPSSGAVTIEAYNALGTSMGYLCRDKVFSDGRHELLWEAGKLPNGVYILRMSYGNEVISARVVCME